MLCAHARQRTHVVLCHRTEHDGSCYSKMAMVNTAHIPCHAGLQCVPLRRRKVRLQHVLDLRQRPEGEGRGNGIFPAPFVLSQDTE